MPNDRRAIRRRADERRPRGRGRDGASRPPQLPRTSSAARTTTILREFEGGGRSGPSPTHEGGSGRRQGPPPRRRRRARRARRIQVTLARRAGAISRPSTPVVEGRAAVRSRPTASGARERLPRPQALRSPVLIHGDASFAGQGDVAETLEPRGRPSPAIRRAAHANDREQPGRLHDGTVRRPLDALLKRPREGLRRAPIIHVSADDPEAASFDPTPLAFSAPRRRASSSTSWGTAASDTTSRTGRQGTRKRWSEPRSGTHSTGARAVRGKVSARRRAEGRSRPTTPIADDAGQLPSARRTSAQGEHRRRSRNPAGRPHPRDDGHPSATAGSCRAPGRAERRADEGTGVVSRRIRSCRAAAPPHRASPRAASTGARRGGRSLCSCPFSSTASRSASRARTRARHVLAFTATPSSRRRTPEPRARPMKHLDEATASFEIHNSPLSEYACVGFKHGYSAAALRTPLVLWEDPVRRLRGGARSSPTSSCRQASRSGSETSRLTLLAASRVRRQQPGASRARDSKRFLQLAAQEGIRIANPADIGAVSPPRAPPGTGRCAPARRDDPEGLPAA